MSTDLQEQLYAYFDQVEADQQPVTATEIITRSGSRPSNRSISLTRGRGVLVAFAAAILVLLLGVLPLLFNGGDEEVADIPVVTTLAESTPTTTANAEISTTAPVESEALTTGLSWQRVELTALSDEWGTVIDAGIHDGGDRFVLLHGERTLEAVSTSTDGLNWTTHPVDDAPGDSTGVLAAWEDTVLVVSGGGGWSRTESGPVFPIPSRLSVIHPDGSVNQQVFEGDVLSAAVGPAGMVVVIAPDPSYGVVIDEVLGEDFSSSLYETDLRDGVLYVETFDGRTAEIVLADHGYTAEPFNARGWYSESGGEWAPIADLPPDISVAGTEDGFVGVSPKAFAGSTAWFSADGHTWTTLGDIAFTPISWRDRPQQPMRWRGGVVVTDGSHFAHLSTDGVASIPDPPPVGLLSRDIAPSPFPLYLAGDLGIVVVDPEHGQLLISSDGAEWTSSELPAEMSDSFGWYTSTGAVSDQGVLLLLWESTSGGPQKPSWWLGTAP